MIDIKTKLVLKILAQECGNGNYKIVEISDIIMALPKRYRMDSDAVKHILEHLERQDYISIKYDDEDIYCLAVLPFGFETLESDSLMDFNRKKEKQKKFSVLTFVLCFASALLGTTLGILICYLILR